MAHKENLTNVANMTSCYTRKWNNNGEWSGSNLHIGNYNGVTNYRFKIYFTPSVTLTQVKIGIRFTSYNNEYNLGSYYALENVDTGAELQGEKYLGIWNTSTTYYVTFNRTFTAGTEYAVYFGPKWDEWNYYVGTTRSNISITSTVATFTVTYNANGGTTTKTSQTGSSVTLPTTAQCTRTGYQLAGWAKSSTATSASYSPGASYKPSANITLYAVWIPNTYQVTYNANGGTGAPSAQTKTYGVNLILSSTKPTRVGYIFQGWATSANGAVAYAPGASYTTNSAITLYAVWKADVSPVYIKDSSGNFNAYYAYIANSNGEFELYSAYIYTNNEWKECVM